MKRYATGLMILITAAMPAFADKPAGGTITGWDGRTADIIGIFGTPVVLGGISADGTVRFDLPTDLPTRQPFGALFSCSSGGVELVNPQATYVATSTSLVVGSMQEQQKYGGLIPASSEATALASLNMMRGDTPVGTLYQWMYFSAPAAVTGDCATATTHQDESGEPIVKRVVHDMQLEQGWNLIEVDIQEVQQPANGDHSMATLTRYRTVNSFSDDTAWVFVAEE